MSESLSEPPRPDRAETPQEFWERVVLPNRLWILARLRPTLEEAQALFDVSEPEPLTEEQIQSIIDFALGRKQREDRSNA